MKGSSFLLAILLLSVALLHPPSSRMQGSDPKLPTPADYPAAGENCKRKRKLIAKVTSRDVVFAKTARCELLVHTCKQKPEKYSSGERTVIRGQDPCDDYYAAAALLNDDHMICCDTGPDAEKKCDERQVCDPLARALEVIREARTTVGAASLRYEEMTQALNPLLDQVRSGLCDNIGAQNKVDQIRSLLNQLTRSVGLANEEKTALVAEMRKEISYLRRELCESNSSQPLPSKCEAPTESGPKYRIATNNYKYYPLENDPENVIPLQGCPGCLWELTAVDFSAIGFEQKEPSDTVCHYGYLAIWHCPSTGLVRLMRDNKEIKGRCKSTPG